MAAAPDTNTRSCPALPAPCAAVGDLTYAWGGAARRTAATPGSCGALRSGAVSVQPAVPASAEQLPAPGTVLEIRDETWLVQRAERASDGWFVEVQGLSELVRGTQATFSPAIDDIRPLDPARATACDGRSRVTADNEAITPWPGPHAGGATRHIPVETVDERTKRSAPRDQLRWFLEAQ